MDGHVDTGVGGVTELRIHGVSGSPPDQMLQHPHPRRVAGDATTGFYRRWSPSGPSPDIPGRPRREAYAWGPLTSGGQSPGSRVYALWLLLLPFALANLAHFMAPRPVTDTHPVFKALRHLGEMAQRLFALGLTATLTMGALRICVDLIGWQCTAPGRICAAPGAAVWLQWLAETWPDQASRRLAVCALVPCLLAALLWALARHTWTRNECTEAPGADGEGNALLARSRLWNGERPVHRLRILHTGLMPALIVLAVALPFAAADPAARGLATAGTTLLALIALLTALPATARRIAASEGEPRGERRLRLACHTLRTAAWAVLAGTLVLAWRGFESGPPRSHLAELSVMGTVLFWSVIALAAVVGVATAAAAVRHRPKAPEGRELGEARAAGGLACWLVLVFAGWVAAGFSLGASLWAADLLGTPAFPRQGGPGGRVGDLLFLPDAYWWTAMSLPVVSFVLGLSLLALMARTFRLAALRSRASAGGAYGGDPPGWALASLTDAAGRVLSLVTLVAVTALSTVVVLALTERTPVSFAPPTLLATFGTFGMVALIAGLVLLQRQVSRDPEARRIVGVLWDVATFWPRATHPLAPPCYAERVVPELVERVTTLISGKDDVVVLSGHSQGSVIAVAVVLRLPPATRDKVRLLTHGSPLRRLYSAFFPAYFGSEAMGEARRLLGDGHWRNLYRPTDPIAGPVFERCDPENGTARDGAIDRFLWDPSPPAGHGGKPGPLLGHADYFDDKEYGESLAHLTKPQVAAPLREPSTPGAP
ncbi:hypothetical protein [Sinosporangium siamense]|uniref:Integral membrane protein n=1 Tax=Sinosporangium siamense TaxID=1367973 RepID=A0A919RH99_9ACTN|nr:hypothetical protein [Sinosporangium siamense]GII93865.1 hypothetical protein Ssi02_40960 [Sinosporangium siamense]